MNNNTQVDPVRGNKTSKNFCAFFIWIQPTVYGRMSCQAVQRIQQAP